MSDEEQIEIISFPNAVPTGPAESPPPSPRRPATILAAAAATLIAAIALVTVVLLDDDPIESTPADATTTTTTTTLAPAPSEAAYAAILPSVVVVQASPTVDQADDEPAAGFGSGVVIAATGTVATALHVIDGATEIELAYPDGSRTNGTVALTFADADLAIIEPDQPPALVVPAVIGGPGRVRVGSEAFAVGHPLGLTASLSAGVISGFDRTAPLEDGTSIDGLIQFDTAVNPGNSGGPLIDRDGVVIGIVTALLNPSGDESFSGIGFASPLPGGGGGIGPDR
ncbi:MAG: trypsin-like peptidase domain-containing protein [Actinomycetota bacterium]